jgi:hypothetical protein
MAKKLGRPDKYDFELCKEICLELYNYTNLSEVLNTDDRFPARSTFFKWKREHKDLAELYYAIPRMKKFKNNTWSNDKYRVDGKFCRLKYAKVRGEDVPMLRVKRSISSRIGAAIRKERVSIEKMLPYGSIELKRHLEGLFTKGMSWDNYGDWHIDHVIPHSYFDYKTYDCDEFVKCWELSNLQPLWAIDNMIKGNRYVG